MQETKQPFSNHTVSIFGYGRFGQLLAKILAEDFPVSVYDPILKSHPINQFTNFEMAAQADTLFLAVPIRHFKQLILDLVPHLNAWLKPCTIIDVCSIKEYPVKIMKEYLPGHVDIIATHPLFGPDSLKQPVLHSPEIVNTINPPKIMMYSVKNQYQQYAFWQNYFKKKNFTTLEMSPATHDELAAKTQGITHFIGRVLNAMPVESTVIDTQGFQNLLQIVKQTCNDRIELFQDMERYNPHSKKIIETFIEQAHLIKDDLFAIKDEIKEK